MYKWACSSRSGVSLFFDKSELSPELYEYYVYCKLFREKEAYVLTRLTTSQKVPKVYAFNGISYNKYNNRFFDPKW